MNGTLIQARRLTRPPARRGGRDRLQPKPARSGSLLLRLLQLVVLFVFAHGFLNLISGSVQIGALGLDVLVVLAVASGFMRLGRLETVPFAVFAVFVLVLVYAVLATFSTEDAHGRLYSFRNVGLYSLLIVPVVTLTLRRDEPRRLLATVQAVGAVSAIVGILQSQLGERLPDSLLVAPGETVSGYVGTEIIRATGLLGNPIEYGHIMLLLFALSFAEALRRPRLRVVLACLLFAGAVLASYSRVAIVGLAVVAAGLALWRLFGSGRAGLQLVALLCAPALAFGAVAMAGGGSQTADRLYALVLPSVFTQSNASVEASNAGHELIASASREAIASNWFSGVGVGSQQLESSYSSSNVVATDGTYYALLLEGGVLLLGAMLLVLIPALARLVRKRPRGYEGVVLFSLYLMVVANWYNSAFLGKSVYITFWIVLGVMLGESMSRRSAVSAGSAKFGVTAGLHAV